MYVTLQLAKLFYFISFDFLETINTGAIIPFLTDEEIDSRGDEMTLSRKILVLRSIGPRGEPLVTISTLLQILKVNKLEMALSHHYLE